MPLSRRSKRHEECVDTLRCLYPAIKIKEEYKIGNNQFIDIFLPAYDIGIEVDGAQHEFSSSFFHGTDGMGFKLQQFLDRKKNFLCKEKGIFLYRIKSTDNRDMKSIITDMLIKHLDDSAKKVDL